MKTLAIDFDGLLCENKYPNIGKPKWNIINMIKARQKDMSTVLWTCRRDKQLEEALNACKEWGVEINYVNENAPDVVRSYGCDPRKVVAVEYWDDRAVNPVAVQKLKEAIYKKMEDEPENEQVLQEVLWLVKKEMGV